MVPARPIDYLKRNDPKKRFLGQEAGQFVPKVTDGRTGRRTIIQILPISLRLGPKMPMMFKQFVHESNDTIKSHRNSITMTYSTKQSTN